MLQARQNFAVLHAAKTRCEVQKHGNDFADVDYIYVLFW